MTTMTASATQVYSVFVRATPEQLWDAITKPEFTRKYFYGSVFDSTFEAGSTYCAYDAEGGQQYIEGEVIEASKPNKLVTSWRALWAEALAGEPRSRVTWEIESTGDGVSKLTVVHDKLDGAPATAEVVAGGWSYILSGMKSVVETGKALEG